MLKDYIKPGDFIQVMCPTGSQYGTVESIDEPWIALRDAKSRSINILSVEPSTIVGIITGDEAHRNHKEAEERSSQENPFESLMGMVEKSMSKQAEQ